MWLLIENPLNLVTEADATNQTITYGYNAASQVTGMSSSNTAAGNPAQLISNVQEGPNGPVSYEQGNGLGDYSSYDALGRNSGSWICRGNTPSAQCQTGSEAEVYGTQLSWSGSQVKMDCDTVMGTCRNFGYDEFSRLKSQRVTSGTTQNFIYGYDRYGNRWQQSVNAGSGPAPSVTFNKGTNQVIGDSYDEAGNMTSDGIHTYTYDAEGNVTAVDGGNTATYMYDALTGGSAWRTRRTRWTTSSTARGGGRWCGRRAIT